jgi:hypothetical protein
MKFRTHTCVACKHQWTSRVVMSKHSPAISGERTEQCPACNSKGISSSPWHDAPTIISIRRQTAYGSCSLFAAFDDGFERLMFSFYTDELSFEDSELIGLTEDAAHKLRQERDIAYLRS